MKRRWLSGVFILAILSHIESLSYWFVATDTLLLIQSSQVGSISGLIDIFTHPLMGGTSFTKIAHLYRPVSGLSYMIDYWIWGLTPTGYHLTNLLLHGVATVLVAITVAELTDRPTVGILSATLFALHPVVAEIVPPISRRQDILMAIFFLGSLTLFVRSQRRPKGYVMLGASLVTYGLAIGAKEPALIVPCLVFAWALFDQEQYINIEALRTSLRTVIPFGVVAAIYLAIRIAVLGGLGGYQLGVKVTTINKLTSVMEFVLSIAYPSDVIGVSTQAVNGWTILLGGLVLLALFILVCGFSSLNRSIPEIVLFTGFVCGLGLIPLVLLFEPSLGTELLVSLEYLPPPARHPYGYPQPMIALLGVTFVGACSLGLGWAILARTPSLDQSDRKALVMFLVWLLSFLVMFLVSGVYALWNSYLATIPAMAILSLLLVSGGRTLDQRDTFEVLNANTALIGLILLLVLPLIATSPLFHSYDGWEAAGEVNQLTLTSTDHALKDAPSNDSIAVARLPREITAQERAFPRVKSIVYLNTNAIETWHELQYPNRDIRVTAAGTGSSHLQSTPDRVTIETTTKQGTRTLYLHYKMNRSPSAAMSGTQLVTHSIR